MEILNEEKVKVICGGIRCLCSCYHQPLFSSGYWGNPKWFSGAHACRDHCSASGSTHYNCVTEDGSQRYVDDSCAIS